MQQRPRSLSALLVATSMRWARDSVAAQPNSRTTDEEGMSNVGNMAWAARGRVQLIKAIACTRTAHPPCFSPVFPGLSLYAWRMGGFNQVGAWCDSTHSLDCIGWNESNSIRSQQHIRGSWDKKGPLPVHYRKRFFIPSIDNSPSLSSSYTRKTTPTCCHYTNSFYSNHSMILSDSSATILLLLS
jgi:hypothetical protein